MERKTYKIIENYLPIVAACAPSILGPEATKKYSEGVNTSARYKLLTGGRGTGKTKFITWLAITLTYSKDKSNVLYLRYTMVDARQTIAQDIHDTIKGMGVDGHFYTEQKDGFKFVNNATGNYILIRGVKAQSLNQTANVKGLNDFAHVIIDEAEEFTNQELFDKLDYSIRQTGINNIVISLNPATRSHFIYKRWLKNSKKLIDREGHKVEVSTSDNVLHVHTTFRDLPREFLSEGWINNVEHLKISDPDKYGHLILGQWRDVAQGAIFEFSTYNHHDPDGVSCLAIDYGSRNPTVVLKVTLVDNQIFIRQLWHKRDTTLQERVEKITSLARQNNTLDIVTDHDIDMSDALGLRGVRTINADKRSVNMRIDLMKDYDIRIHTDSAETIDEFSRYHYRDGTETPVKVDDHSCDAAGYGFMYLHGLSLSNQPKTRRRVRSVNVPRWREH